MTARKVRGLEDREAQERKALLPSITLQDIVVDGGSTLGA